MLLLRARQEQQDAAPLQHRPLHVRLPRPRDAPGVPGLECAGGGRARIVGELRRML